MWGFSQCFVASKISVRAEPAIVGITAAAIIERAMASSVVSARYISTTGAVLSKYKRGYCLSIRKMEEHHGGHT